MNPFRNREKIPLVHALAGIVVSTLLISGAAYTGLKYYLQRRCTQALDPDNRIVRIVQTGPEKEALTTFYLAELMDLSTDRPTSLWHFDEKKAREQLLRSPVIKEASVKAMKPGTLYVDYTVRTPIAWLYEYENVAIDEEGYLFPFYPFFSPKNLPEFYLGLPSFADWHTPVRGKEIELALAILNCLCQPDLGELFQVRRIDVSNAYADSCGTREIVLRIEEEVWIGRTPYILPRLLRLSTKNYPQELGNYLKLRAPLLEKEAKQLKEGGEAAVRLPEKIIDLRIPQLAFIE